MMEDTGFPKGYHAEHYRRDTDIFAKWLKENYPECLYVGPSATGGDVVFGKGGGGVIFHNTLAAPDYAFLERIVFNPRPNYFAVLLWNRLMGTTVYDTKEAVREGAHVYAQSRKDGKDGVCYLLINNSETEATTVEVPAGIIYTLAGKDGNKRATVMTLNGRDLVLGENNELPDLSGAAVAAGTIELAPMTCTFLVV